MTVVPWPLIIYVLVVGVGAPVGYVVAAELKRAARREAQRRGRRAVRVGRSA